METREKELRMIGKMVANSTGEEQREIIAKALEQGYKWNEWAKYVSEYEKNQK